MSAKNTSDYTFAPHTPVHEIIGYHVDESRQGKDAGILVHGIKLVKGLAVFGPQAGVITEDDLTPAIVDFIMSKKNEDGSKMYESYLVRKDGKKVTPTKVTPPVATDVAALFNGPDGKPLKGKALIEAKAKAAEEAAKIKPADAAEGAEKKDEDFM